MIENLVPEYSDHLEGLSRSDRVDEHVTVNAYEVLRIEYAVLILEKSPEKLEWSIVAADRFENLEFGHWAENEALPDPQYQLFPSQSLDCGV